MKHALSRWMLAALVASGCSKPSAVVAPPLPVPVVSDVVARALAAPEAQPLTRPDGLDDGAAKEARGLLEFTASSNGDMARAGREDLLRLGPGAMTTLAALASETERAPAQRAAALATLAEGPADLAAVLLGEILSKAKEPWMRANAAWYLGTLSDDRWVPDAVLVLKYEIDASVVRYLAQALARRGYFCGLPALATLAPTDAEAAALAETIAAEHGYANARDLDSAWRAGTAPVPERDAALTARIWHWIGRLGEFQLRGVDDARFVLVDLGAVAAPQLGAALLDQDTYIRTHACQCLERMGPRGRVAASELAAQLGAPVLGSAAAVALGSVGGDVARDALLASLDESRGIELQLGAARGLALLADPLSAKALTERFALERTRSPELAQALAEAVLVAATSASERATAMDHLVTCLVEPGLEPTSSGLAIEAFLVRAAGNENSGASELLDEWNAIGGKRGPTYDEATMWRERSSLLVSKRAVWADWPTAPVAGR